MLLHVKRLLKLEFLGNSTNSENWFYTYKENSPLRCSEALRWVAVSSNALVLLITLIIKL